MISGSGGERRRGRITEWRRLLHWTLERTQTHTQTHIFHIDLSLFSSIEDL